MNTEEQRHRDNIEKACYRMYVNPDRPFYRKFFMRQVRKYVNFMIVYDCGLWVEIRSMNDDQLIDELSGNDEIRAYLAAEALLQDNRIEKVSQLKAIMDRCWHWQCMSNYDWSSNWLDYGIRFRDAKSKLQDQFTCHRCGRQFDCWNDFDDHFDVYIVKWNKPSEVRCKTEPDYDRDHDDIECPF
jgi:hypothetical protein